MQTLIQDLRYGLRILLNKPSFTLIAVLTLALGIGTNTAIFSLLYQVLLRNLPVRQPEQLVVLKSPGPKQGMVSSDTSEADEPFSHPMYRDLRDRNEVFSGLLARFPVSLNIAFQGQTERTRGELVSGNYFDVLGVQAAFGRTFSLDDDQTPGAHPVVVLSHSFWTRRFGSDRQVLNQTINVNGHVMTIVGVAQQGFSGVQLGQMPDIFIPLAMKAQMTPNWDDLNNRRAYWLNILGRLKPGLTREQAQAGLLPLYHSLLESELPQQNRFSADQQQRFINKPILLEDGSRGRLVFQNEIRTPILVMMGMVALVLLITCVNVASLLIARGVARQKEIAVRQALGAGRWRLIRQLLAESVLLSVVGGLLGLLVAVWTLSGLLYMMPDREGLTNVTADLNYRLLAFNFSLAVITGILFGLVPAMKTTRTDLVTALKEQGMNISSRAAQARFRSGLVVVEIALTMILLVSAGLFAQNLYNLMRVDPGVRTQQVIAFSIAPSLNGYKPAQAIELFHRLEESLATLPGVESVSASEVPLFAGDSMGSNITVEGYTPSEGDDTHAFRNQVGPGYFGALGIPLLAGREFTAQDTAQSQKVAIINQSLAQKYFGNGNPIGRRIDFGKVEGKPLEIEIIGIVQDSKHASVRDEIRKFVYIPYMQNKGIGRLTYYVRTTQSLEAIATSLRSEVARLDASLPVYNLQTLNEQIRSSLSNDRLLALLSSAFGLLAALLAAIGIYGVMSYSVTQRTQEIGIRMALGAQTRDVVKLVIGQGMKLTIAGVAIGLFGAYALMKLIKSLLFGVNATDPKTFVVVAVLLTVVALLACYIPARRATKVDPITSLRYE
jgi:putative ABC transport system permease protein